ncbi:hypothetical protein L6232_22935, partial [Shewanella sp. C31]|nr:hypothetical protein [Shewanella electrica]
MAAYDPSYVPDSVRTFVSHLYRHIRDRNVYETHQMSEGGFTRHGGRRMDLGKRVEMRRREEEEGGGGAGKVEDE